MRSPTTPPILALSLSALIVGLAPNAGASEAAPGAARPPSGPAPGAATPPPSFGDQGEVVIGSATTASGFSQLNQGTQNDLIQVEPSIDYFVARHFSVGGALTFSYSATSYSGGSAHTFSYGIAPRIGYDIPLSDSFSLWPRLSVDFRELNETGQSAGVATAVLNEGGVAVELYVPVLFHPVPHFFIGFGPYAEAGSPSGEVVGAKLTLGGWFGG